MPDLVEPVTSVHRSFVAAMEEFRAEGRGGRLRYWVPTKPSA
ncbi:hypothetical protein [Actinomadura latina]|nr:hypothetical protein [Actinomadura latina]